MALKNYLWLATAAVILTGSVKPEPDPATRVIDAYNQYLSQYPQEKIYLHTDRSHYAAGETIWFKGYQFHAHYNLPMSLSKVIYLELVNSQAKVVIQSKYQADSGKVAGALVVPEDLPSDYYQLRAYTRWMLNFDHRYIFSKDIFIGSSYRRGPADLPIEHLQIAAEGGNLVDQLMTRLVVYAMDQHHNPIVAQGILYNEQDTIQQFKTNSNGFSSFTIRPEIDSRYTIKISDSNGEFKEYPLPDIQSQGVTLNVTDAGVNFLRVLVQSTAEYYGDSLLITARSQGGIYFTAVGLAGQEPMIVNFPRQELPAGICTLTAFHTEGKVLSEQSVFIYPEDSVQITPSNFTATAKSREKVRLTFKVNDQSGSPITANFSASVAEHAYNQRDTSSLRDFLYLTSDLGDYGYRPVIGHHQHMEVKQINQLLTINPPSRISWSEVFSNPTWNPSIPPETQGYTLEGTLSSTETGQRLTGQTIMLSSPEIPGFFQWTVTDSSGNFYLPNLNITGSHQAVLKLNDTLLTGAIPEISLIPERTVSSPVKKMNTRRETNIPQEAQLRAQIAAVYRQPQAEIAAAKADSSYLYGAPDRSIILSDYVELPNMAEVFREILPGVRLRDRQGVPEIRVIEIVEDYITGETVNRYQDEGPLLLVNNVPIFDPQLIVDLDPGILSRVDIVYGKQSLIEENLLQELPFKGILAFYTEEPVLDNIGIKGIHRFDLVGYSPVRKFTAIDPTGFSSTHPDLRTLLYWNDNLTTNDEGVVAIEFFTSDVSSTFGITLEGLTEDGLPLHYFTTFTVDPSY